MTSWRACFVAIVTTVLAASASPVLAQGYPRLPINISHMTLGYTYFNRAGATVERHNADLGSCMGEAVKTISADAMLSGGRNDGLVGNLIAGGLASAANRGTTASAVENCMIVKGWRVVLLPEAKGQALAGMTDADVAAELGKWIGVSEPEGKVFRAWRNEAADAAIERWSLRPPHINDGLLSLRLLKLGDVRDARKAVVASPTGSSPILTRDMLKVDKSWPSSRYEPAKMPKLPENGAVLIFGMAGGITALELERVGSDPAVRPVTLDHKPDRFRAFGKWGAYIVPPGRWRIRAMTKALLTINMCLGSPAFEIKSGEVLFGGAFDLNGSQFGPDMDIAKAKAWLGQGALADRVAPVAWSNGSTGECGDSTIFALEFPGYPFAEGYSWGSKVRP